jgi:hypothetical protein
MMTTEPKSAGMPVHSGAGRRVLFLLCALSLACAFGCQAVGTAPAEATVGPANAAPTVEQTAQRTGDEHLLTPRQVGRARLGMSVGEVKRLFPSATFRVVPLPDIPAIVAVGQAGGEDILYFGTARTGDEGGGALPRDDERVTQLVTKDPRFRTAEGIGPGSSLEDATKAYGAVTLLYSPDVEYAKFGAGPAAGLGFIVTPPSGQKSAGIYGTSPEETEGGFRRSARFHPGARISYVSISDDEKADGPHTAGQSQATAQVAAPLQSVLGKVKKETKVPVLLPGELPHTLSRQTLFASGEGKPDGYEISLSSRPRCGANSCFVGSFEARRGEQPAFERQVQLAENVKGYYQPLSCGGSCSPPIIEWVSGGVLYHIQLDVHWRTKLGEDEELRLMIEVANSAIRGGAR